MLTDTFNLFADAESFAGETAGTDLFGDVIDLGQTSNYIGNGKPLYLILTIDTQIITSGTAGTIQFALMSGPEAAITTAPTTHLLSPTLLTDDATAVNAAIAAGTEFSNFVGGRVFQVAIPAGTYQRYLGLKRIIGTTTVSAGAVTAALVDNLNTWRAVPKGTD